jgi:hypothetical protein
MPGGLLKASHYEIESVGNFSIEKDVGLPIVGGEK